MEMILLYMGVCGLLNFGAYRVAHHISKGKWWVILSVCVITLPALPVWAVADIPKVDLGGIFRFFGFAFGMIGGIAGLVVGHLTANYEVKVDRKNADTSDPESSR